MVGSPSSPIPDSPTPAINVSASATDTPATPTAPAPEPATDARGNDTSACAESEQSPRAIQLSPEQDVETRNLAILDALSRGETYREITTKYKVSTATLAMISKRMAELETGAVSKLMQAKTLQMLEAWETAAIQGAMSGKHAPAKEWLTHARALAPVVSDSGNTGAKVAIIIGQPGSPVDPMSLQVIDVQGDSTE